MTTVTPATPLSVTLAIAAGVGFVATASLALWLERGPAILLDLSSLGAAFICF